MKEQMEKDLFDLLRDLKGLSPKTSTYIKLKGKEKELRIRLRELDYSYAKVCKREDCYEFAVMKHFFDGKRRYFPFCSEHRSENILNHNPGDNPFTKN